MKGKGTAASTVWFVVAATLIVSGCSRQEVRPAGVDPVGTYELVSVNGKLLPADVSHDGHALQVRSGTFIINADGTCSSKTVFVPPSGGEVAREVAATYTMEGSKLTMKWEGAGTTVGTIQGIVFRMDNEGMVFVYSKQVK